MSSRNINEQDFGSESDSEDFNPAPQDDSDAESARKASPPPKRRDRETSSKKRSPSPKQRRRHVSDDEDDDEEEEVRPRKAQRARDDSDDEVAQRRRSPTRSEASDRSASPPPKSKKRREARRNDDDDMDEDDEEEDEEAERRRKRKNRPVSEDEDDEEEEEEEEVDRGHRRKRRREFNQFIDVEAEVDTDEDEDDEDEDGGRDIEGFIAPGDAENDEEVEGGYDDRRHRQLDQERQREIELDAEKQAELFRQRYGRRERVGGEAAYIPKRLLLPSVNDPSIWGIKCKPGKEREVVLMIMKRLEERAQTKNPLKITAAFERKETIQGYLYVEARSVTDVESALDGLLNVYPRNGKLLVPIKEMPDLLRTNKTKELEPGQYIRIKRGLYQGDLAQIIEVENHGRDAILRIVPRLDYGLNEDLNGAQGSPSRKGRVPGYTNGVRPPARLFSEAEARKRHSRYLQRRGGGGYIYKNEEYVDDFLIKSFKNTAIESNDVKPTLEEVTRFTSKGEDGVQNLDLKSLATTLKDSTSHLQYVPGDVVEVFDSELKGTWGNVENVSNDIVTVQVSEGDLRNQKIEVPVKNLRKKFSLGDHLRVTGASKYADEVGMVTRIQDDKVTILTDNSMQEITVFSKDLVDAREFTAITGDTDKLNKLIQLDPTTVGVVIRADRTGFGVIDQFNKVRTILPSQAQVELDARRNVVATDRDGAEIHPGDVVKEVLGDRRQGKLLHVYRTFAFVQFLADPSNVGMFATRTSNLISVSAKSGAMSNGTLDLTKQNPLTQRNMNAPPQVMKAPRFGRDKAIGQTVTVRKGPQKGLMGIVRETTDEFADIELHSTGKIKRVPKDSLGFKEYVSSMKILISFLLTW
jgi:transcription elongation factor SPT5